MSNGRKFAVKVTEFVSRKSLWGLWAEPLWGPVQVKSQMIHFSPVPFPVNAPETGSSRWPKCLNPYMYTGGLD